jgi:hypothetical protein
MSSSIGTFDLAADDNTQFFLGEMKADDCLLSSRMVSLRANSAKSRA